MNPNSQYSAEDSLRDLIHVDPREALEDMGDSEIFDDSGPLDERPYDEQEQPYDGGGWPGDGSGTDDLADHNQNEADDYQNE